MSAIIAQRDLQVVGENGIEHGFVRLHAPEERDGAFWCAVHLKLPCLEQNIPIAGADSYQALVLAMQFVPNLVSFSDAFRAGRLHELGSTDPLKDLAFSFGFAPLEGRLQ